MTLCCLVATHSSTVSKSTEVWLMPIPTARLLIFATDEQLTALKDATHVYFDATFTVVPALYYQLFAVFVPFAN